MATSERGIDLQSYDASWSLDEAKSIELINLRYVSTVFQHGIIDFGKLIYSRNAFKVATFKLMTCMRNSRNDDTSAILE